MRDSDNPYAPTPDRNAESLFDNPPNVKLNEVTPELEALGEALDSSRPPIAPPVEAGARSAFTLAVIGCIFPPIGPIGLIAALSASRRIAQSAYRVQGLGLVQFAIALCSLQCVGTAAFLLYLLGR